MKTTIIAASLFASFAAVAAPIQTESQMFNFSAEKEASCSLNIVKDNAPIIFNEFDMTSGSNYAKADLVSDLVKKATVTVAGDWAEVSAWGGAAPDVRVSTVMYDTMEGNEGHHETDLNFERTYNLEGKANQTNSFTMAVLAPDMTSVGKGSLNTTVQFTCE